MGYTMKFEKKMEKVCCDTVQFFTQCVSSKAMQWTAKIFNWKLDSHGKFAQNLALHCLVSQTRTKIVKITIIEGNFNS